jgi:hypothetical protein
MRNIADKIDMNVLEEIIKLAEQAMTKGVSKQKPELAAIEVSVEKEPMEGEEKGMEMPENESPESEMESEDNMSEEDIMDLMEEYKKKKGS